MLEGRTGRARWSSQSLRYVATFLYTRLESVFWLVFPLPIPFLVRPPSLPFWVSFVRSAVALGLSTEHPVLVLCSCIFGHPLVLVRGGPITREWGHYGLSLIGAWVLAILVPLFSANLVFRCISIQPISYWSQVSRIFN